MAVMKPFNVLTVPLKGSNLIEASAGTGKTYSVAILVLRLILEQELPVQQILMVTFTNAAVAELEVRIRLFLRKAYSFACGEEAHGDENIQEVVLRAVEKAGGREPVKDLLCRAVRNLDETQIMTIHGFCREVLQEFAFESGQAFDPEVITDQTLLIERTCNQFWREEISVLDQNTLELLFNDKNGIQFSKDILSVFMAKVLEGKTLISGSPEEDRIGPEKDSPLPEPGVLLLGVSRARESFCRMAEAQFPRLSDLAGTNKHARRMVEESASSAEFIQAFEKKINTQYVASCFPELYGQYRVYAQRQEELSRYRNVLLEKLLFKLQQIAVDRMQEVKGRKNVVGFDDMIHSVWNAVQQGAVNELLREKYKAIFIDEFQDTDREQYQIFRTVFSGGKTASTTGHAVFYIGDPKQSIYRWRKADLNTYKTARDQVDAVYTMNCNFRSTPGLVGALNTFFALDNAFLDEGITYFAVAPGTDRRALKQGDGPAVPLSVSLCRNQEEIKDFVCRRIVKILSDKQYRVPEGQSGYRRVRPSDIGVIVRTNKQGKEMKAMLARINVPAVTIDDAKVLSSEEARQIHYVLLAILSPDRTTLGRALLNRYFGFDTPDVLHMDEEKELERFRHLYEKWNSSGIYNALSAFLKIYRVRYFCTAEDNMMGQRAITNYLHTMELLHRAEVQSALSARELISWFARKISGSDSTADEYQQRVESDENAVQITTIHKCKGLSYGIVFAPFLSMTRRKKDGFLEFRTSGPDGRYVMAVDRTAAFEQIANEQVEQENRRMIYVALTRAVYKCYVCGTNGSSSLKPFLDAVSEDTSGTIHTSEYEEDTINTILRNEEVSAPVDRFFNRSPDHIPAMQGAWSVQSYSSLTRDMPYVPVQENLSHPGNSVAASSPDPAPAETSAYDSFIFERLPKGAKTGLMIHSLFEEIAFDDPSLWAESVERVRKTYPSLLGEADAEHLLTMIAHVLNVRIHGDLVLSKIARRDRVSEMAFFYEQQHGGLMTGVVDLFFRYGGKFYILDWKSNFLGDRLEDYAPKALDHAITESRYDLQYSIYFRAALRYLEKKVPGFEAGRDFGGVIYLFVRGIRQESPTGIHFRSAARVLDLPYFKSRNFTIL